MISQMTDMWLSESFAQGLNPVIIGPQIAMESYWQGLILWFPSSQMASPRALMVGRLSMNELQENLCVPENVKVRVFVPEQQISNSELDTRPYVGHNPRFEN